MCIRYFRKYRIKILLENFTDEGGGEDIFKLTIGNDNLHELIMLMELKPVTVTERSKVCTVFARSEAAIVGSNPNQGMDV
jgi:hypothetical protein